MPRKRTTRAVNTHAKPKLKDSDDMVNGMTLAERKAKLDSLLKDFDLNVENICRQYEEELVSLEKLIDKQFYQMRCKLSPMELQMTVEQYLEFTQTQSEDQENTEIAKSAAIPVTSALLNSKNALSKYSSLRCQPVMDTIPEKGEASTQAPKRQRRKRGVANKVSGVTFSAEPLSAVQHSYITPVIPRNIALAGWGATPLVTPKFDPRLPITPANSRRVKPGEVAMSLAGSPLSMVSDDRSKTLVLSNGQEFEIEIPDRADIKSLMSTLKGIMEKGEDLQT